MTDGSWYEQYIVRDPEILSGTPVIASTRLPAAVVAAYVKAGMTIDKVVTDFHAINPEQAQAAVEYVRPTQGPNIPAPEPFGRLGKPTNTPIVQCPRREPRELS